MPLGTVMAAEIAEQPQALGRLLENRTAIREVAARIASFQPRFVVFAARGTSDNAALYGKYLVEVGLGLPAGLTSMSTLTTYGARPRFEGVLWIAVSQSGGSPDLVSSTETARAAGALTVAVTNNATSALAQAADLHVDIHAGPELAVAATKTYTCELLALWLLVEHWRGGTGDRALALPGLAADVLGGTGAAELAARARHAGKLVTTGRGYAHATAREAALKLMETCYLPAQAFSAADLLHGPVAMVDEACPVVAVVSSDAAGATMTPLLGDLSARGVPLTVVGRPTPGSSPDLVIDLPAVDPDLAPLLEILPLQQAALQMAIDRDVDPDAPRGLNKVTETW